MYNLKNGRGQKKWFTVESGTVTWITDELELIPDDFYSMISEQITELLDDIDESVDVEWLISQLDSVFTYRGKSVDIDDGVIDNLVYDVVQTLDREGWLVDDGGDIYSNSAWCRKCVNEWLDDNLDDMLPMTYKSIITSDIPEWWGSSLEDREEILDEYIDNREDLQTYMQAGMKFVTNIDIEKSKDIITSRAVQNVVNASIGKPQATI